MIKKKKAWFARHKNDKIFNSLHSGIYNIKEFLLNEPTLEKAIKRYEKKHNVNVVNKT